MKEIIKILFTSVGRRVELLQCFRNAAERIGQKIKIIGADISDNAPALFFCDEAIRVCRISDENYIPMLLSICEQKEIDLLIPTIDTDLMILSKNKKQFQLIGTNVLVSAEDKIALCRDKRNTADFFVECGLKTPYPVDDFRKYENSYPCFIKPIDGSSSINAYRINDQEELKAYAKRVGNYIIQPFISGKEYTVDIFCDFEGAPLYITPRERMEVRSGEVLKTCIVKDAKMVDESIKIIEHFKPCGPITVQFIKDSLTNENYYIEINPRFGGGAPLSIKAGADSAEALIKLCRGETCACEKDAAKEGAVYSRFDQSVCVYPKEVDKRKVIHSIGQVLNLCTKYQAVVFDLDDTLYAEIDYVKSGFSKIAEILKDIPEANQQLWQAFIQGKNAIDVVLKENGCYTEEKKNECLNAYRMHIPEIELYKEARALIESLVQEKKKLGIITDGRPKGQRAKIEQLGLLQYPFEIIITDELAGNGNPLHFRKPSVIAFEVMRRRLNCEFADMVYIGDNAAKDFQAPESLGMGTIWFQNPDGLYNTK